MEDIEIRAFTGLATNLDTADAKPGAAEVQINLQVNEAGKMETRPGLRPIVWES